MAIQSYSSASWYRSASDSVYASVSAQRDKLRAYHDSYLETSASQASSLASAQASLSSGMAEIVTKIATQRVNEAVQAKYAQLVDTYA